jgi:hypothetical protein
MSETSMIGKAKELAVASQLVRLGVHVYLPLVDDGIDLIAASNTGTVLMPIQVKYKASRTGFALDEGKVKDYPENTVLVFGTGPESTDADETFHFFPITEWRTEAEKHGAQREDGKLVIYNSKLAQGWAVRYSGDAGIRRAFAAILSANAAGK